MKMTMSTTDWCADEDHIEDGGMGGGDGDNGDEHCTHDGKFDSDGDDDGSVSDDDGTDEKGDDAYGGDGDCNRVGVGGKDRG